MFNDAASVKAGRLIDRNPFQKLGISRGKGRRDQQPPTEQKVWEIIAHARKLACPSFAAGCTSPRSPAQESFAARGSVNELEMSSEEQTGVGEASERAGLALRQVS